MSQECPSCGGQAAEDPALQGLCPRCLAANCLLGPSSIPLAETVRRLGDFELTEEIGRGGMGIVYRAQQLALRRTVAVKVLLGGAFVREEFAKRFQQESELAARLQHPHIVTVHEVGKEDDLLYYVMEYVEGTNLSHWTPGAVGKFSKIAAMLAKIARAVAHAHEHGVLHRDLKPSNILIDLEAEPRIADFGLAKPLSGESELTITSEILGSPPYMAPEQASGRKGEVSPLSDVYSLGAVLYFLLTGRPPFQGETLAQILAQVTEAPPVSPRRLNPAVPIDLDTICLKCLEKTPSRRYASATDLADDLDRFFRHEPVIARPVGPIGRSWRWAQRKPALAAACAGILALLLTTIGLQWRAYKMLAAETSRVKSERDSNRDFVTMVTEDLGPTLEPLGQLDLLAEPVEAVRRYYEKQPNIEADTDAIASYAPLLIFEAEFLQQKEGRISESEKQVKEAFRLLEIAHKRDPSRIDVALRFARACQYRAWTHRVLGRPQESPSVLHRGLAAIGRFSPQDSATGPILEAYFHLTTEQFLSDRMMGKDSLEQAFASQRLAEKMVSTGGDLGRRKQLINRYLWAVATSRISTSYRTRKDPEHGLHYAREFETALEQLLREWPEATRWQSAMTTAKLWVGACLMELGRHEEARVVFQTNADLARRLSKLHPDNLDWRYHDGTALDWLGRSLSACQDYENARVSFESAMEAILTSLSRDGSQADWVARLQEVGDHYTVELLRAGARDEARSLWGKIIAARERQISRTPDAIVAYVGCGDAWLKRSEILESGEEAKTDLRQGAGSGAAETQVLWGIVRARCWQGIGRRAAKEGGREQAREAFEQARMLLEPVLKPTADGTRPHNNDLPKWLVELASERFSLAQESGESQQLLAPCQRLCELAEDLRQVSADQSWAASCDKFLSEAVLTLAKLDVAKAKALAQQALDALQPGETTLLQPAARSLGP